MNNSRPVNSLPPIHSVEHIFGAFEDLGLTTAAHAEALGFERATLDNPDLPASFVAESLKSLAEPRENSLPFVPRSGTLA